MKVHTYEKAFLAVGVLVLVLCAGALVYASVGMGMHLPGRGGTIDPAAVYSTAPFNKPGVRQIGPGRYEVVLVGQAWAFNPAQIRLPRGSEVTFVGTSVDIIHGLHIERTRLNMMLIPGQISRNTITLKEPGEHLVICHEYCGLGHHMMVARLFVE